MREYFSNSHCYPTISITPTAGWLSKDRRSLQILQQKIPIPSAGGRAISLSQTLTYFTVLTDRGYVLVADLHERRWRDIPLGFAVQFLTNTYAWGLQGQCCYHPDRRHQNGSDTSLIFASADVAIDADYRLVDPIGTRHASVQVEEFYRIGGGSTGFNGLSSTGIFYILLSDSFAAYKNSFAIERIGNCYQVVEGKLEWDGGCSKSSLPPGVQEIAVGWKRALVLTDQGELWALSRTEEPKMIAHN
jgi:hypothetical protein